MKIEELKSGDIVQWESHDGKVWFNAIFIKDCGYSLGLYFHLTTNFSSSFNGIRRWRIHQNEKWKKLSFIKS